MGKSIALISGVVGASGFILGMRYLWSRICAVRYATTIGPGVIAPRPPEQHPLRDQTPFKHLDCTIKPIARFRATVRLLGRKPYRVDQWSFLSPVDIAVGWGPMSDTAVLDEFRIEHKNRWVYFKPKRPHREWDPLKTAPHIANLHLIPARDEIIDMLKLCRLGELISINGYLVDVVGPYCEEWKTSITRSDLGGEACEIVWVKGIEIRKPPQASSRT